MRCPGQDRRYWTEDAVFEVPCPECGASVEFFKDETKGRCTKCGHPFPNPGMDFGCAAWCSVAEQCLGIVPEGDSPPKAQEGALAGRLIQLLGEELKEDSTRMIRALKVFHHSKELVSKEGGDPRIVLAAALLMEIGRSRAGEASAAGAEAIKKTAEILDEAGAGEETVKRVCEIIECHQTGKELDSIEFKMICDADRLATLMAEYSPDERDKVEGMIENQLTTEAAKQRARTWYKAMVGGID